MYCTSRSRAVHSFNSINFTIAKSLWGCGGRQHLPEVEGRSHSDYLARALRQEPQDCQSQTGPSCMILENGKISKFQKILLKLRSESLASVQQYWK